MRAIKVTYRAVFQQPIGDLNPLGLKVGGDILVEVFRRGEGWQARMANAFKPLGKFASASHALSGVAAAFERQIQPWQIWGTVPDNGRIALAAERMLSPDEFVVDKQGKVFFKQAEDYTHILHGPLIDPKLKIPNAACGAQVNADCFISTKANVEPSCKGCAEVWRREYRNK